MRTYNVLRPGVFTNSGRLVLKVLGHWGVETYLTSSRALETSASLPRSSFRIDGGLARVNPVPMTFQLALWKAFTTCLPSRPVAPVMIAVFAIVVVVAGIGRKADEM
jgi:hypothetical protein